MHKRVEAVAAGLAALVPAGRFVAICAPNRLEWLLTDLACFFLGFALPPAWFSSVFTGIVSVPLHVTLTDEDLEAIVRHSDAAVIVFSSVRKCLCRSLTCEQEAKPQCRSLPSRCSSVVALIDMDNEFPRIEPKQSSSMQAINFSDVEKSGQGKTATELKHTADDLVTLMYTSGSTGFVLIVCLRYCHDA